MMDVNPRKGAASSSLVERPEASCRRSTRIRSLLHSCPTRRAGEGDRLTRRELDDGARKMAARLQDTGLAGRAACSSSIRLGSSSSRPSSDACMPGSIAVPAYLPRPNRPMTRLQLDRHRRRPSSRPDMRFAAKQTPVAGQDGMPELRDDPCSSPMTASDRGAVAGELVEIPGAIAIRSPSSSTPRARPATPKGVMITHGNLLHNSGLIQACFGSTPESRGVFWLPLFHDMGLIGGVIQTVYCGGVEHAASPRSPSSSARFAGCEAIARHGRDDQRRRPTSPTTSASRRQRPSRRRGST